MKFLRCKHCGNVATKVFDSGVKIVCCGENMEELVPNTVDAAKEKHVPVLKLNGNVLTVEVGSVPHPMTAAHYIVFVAISNGGVSTIVPLDYNSGIARAEVTVDPSKPLEAYEYCNLHGLWSAKLV